MSKIFLVCIFFILSGTNAVFAEVKLPKIIRDSMVLQRGVPSKIYGWAKPGETVRVTFLKRKYSTTTDESGKWLVRLRPAPAGGPFTMQIDGSNRITLKDILVGDVYLCSGQSNMVHQMELHKERYAAEVVNNNYPQIRQFYIPTLTNLQRTEDDLPAGSWKAAAGQDLRAFSAVAYFFAKAIYEKHHVPVGLINASVGGTPIEAWISETELSNFPAILNQVVQNKDTAYVSSRKRNAAIISTQLLPEKDYGFAGTVKWFDTSYVPKGWHKIIVPGYWEDQGIRDLNGAVWYRKEVNIPEAMIGIPAKIALGRIVDADSVFVNGKLAGTTSYQYPQRRYMLPAGVLKPGKNIITVRIKNFGGKGGFVPDKPYYISAGKDTVDLKGEWIYKVGQVYKALRYGQPVPAFQEQYQPTALFNAMIAPLIGYNVKGILWYQGEANTGNAAAYQRLLPALINDWRALWKQGDLPFLYVQLPNFLEVSYLPTESDWALLREAQLKTLAVPNTAMAVAIDLGEWNDIHPDDKKDVGVRLALAAEKIIYGEREVVYSGPIYKSDTISGKKIILSFTNTGSGLISKDEEPLRWFEVAGADKKFHWASTRIEGDRIFVWNDAITEPKYVRYAWSDNPEQVNFYNREGLPASPFRTDQ